MLIASHVGLAPSPSQYIIPQSAFASNPKKEYNG
jgi:hypothetical protein